ncbi:MAG: DUF86 domain-containing protein [Sedimentisphaerales bacterium]|nr:DUF86 domain-containing protein [Sedimentisphaerales bacterium]
MFDRELVHSLMVQVREWLLTIKKRSQGLTTAEAFIASDKGQETFDSICMLFIAVGENLKRVDQMTEGQLFEKYPEADWTGAMGFRDVIAHQYFQIDHEEVFAIIQDNLEMLLQSVENTIKEVR